MAYVASDDVKDNKNHQVIEFDMKQRQITRSFPLPENPVNLAASAYDPDLLYVSFRHVGNVTNCSGNSGIMEIQLKDGSGRVMAQMPSVAKLLEIDEEHLVAAEYCLATGSRVRKVHKQTGEVVQETEVGTSPFDLMSLPDGTIAVSVNKEDKIIFLEPSTMAIEKELPLSCRSPRVMRLYTP